METARSKVSHEYWDEKIECISQDGLRKLRTLKMQQHLRYTYQNSLFYKRFLDEAGIRPEEITTLEGFYNRVPLLSREELIRNQLAQPPFGDLMAVGIKEIRRIYSSPGPLMMPFSKSDMDDYINTTANGLHICGARRGDIVDIAYSYQWDLAGTMLDDGFRRLGCAVIPGGPGMTKTHIHIMKHLGVSVLRAFPSFAMKLAETAKKMGVNPRTDLKIRLIIIGGETYPDGLKTDLAEEFSAEVRDMYGGAETGFVASECSVGGGMHCFSPAIVEIIDPVTRQHVAPGGAGEIVTTDLSRKGFPLIRYRTGDVVEGLSTEPCACGRTSAKLGKIIGRTDNNFWVKGVLLTPNIVKEVLKKHNCLGNFQIIVDRDQFMDRLLIKVESYDPGAGDGIKEALIDDLRAVTRLRAEIDLVPLGSLANRPIAMDLRSEVHSHH